MTRSAKETIKDILDGYKINVGRCNANEDFEDMLDELAKACESYASERVEEYAKEIIRLQKQITSLTGESFPTCQG